MKTNKQYWNPQFLPVILFFALAIIGQLNAMGQSDNTRGGMVVQWYYGDSDMNTASTDVDNTGISWVRVDCDWNDIQRSGPTSWNWNNPDRHVRYAKLKGLKILLLLSYAPGWANGGQDQYTYHTAAFVNDWKAFCDKAVRRYLPQGVTTYELWNEPNLTLGKANVVFYTNNILKPGSDAVRAASVALKIPVTVVQGGMAYNDYPDISAYGWLKGIYANGGKDYFDVANTHPYCFPNPAPDVYAVYNNLYRVGELLSIMVANGDGSKQIWATEYGFPTKGANSVTEAKQADWMQKAFTVWCKPAWRAWTGPMFWYVYRDADSNVADMFLNFGLVRSDWTKKPAFARLQSIMADTVSFPPPLAPPTSGYSVTTNSTETGLIGNWGFNETGDNLQFKVYPNPVCGGILSVSRTGLFNKSDVQVTILDINGKILIEKTLKSTESKININTLNDGIYIIKLQSAAGQFIGKLVVEL